MSVDIRRCETTRKGTCPVCYEDFKDFKNHEILGHSHDHSDLIHLICKTCCVNWLRINPSSPTCPECRARFSYKSIKRLGIIINESLESLRISNVNSVAQQIINRNHS